MRLLDIAGRKLASIWLLPIMFSAMSSAVFAGTAPYSVLIPITPGAKSTPAQKYLYGVNTNKGILSSYKVNADGSLSAIGSQSFSYPMGVASGPGGKFLYISSIDSNTIKWYAIGSNGGLTYSGSLPIAYAGRLKLSPNQQFLFMSSPSSGYFSSFAINSDGSLSFINRAIFGSNTSGTGSYCAINPLGSLALIASNSSASVLIMGMRISSLGVVSPSNNSSGPYAPANIGFSQDGTTAYVKGYFGVNSYTVDSTGSLIHQTLSALNASMFESSGTHAYGDQTNTGIDIYQIQPDGSVILQTSFPGFQNEVTITN